MKDDLRTIVSTEGGAVPPSGDGLNEVIGAVTFDGMPAFGLQGGSAGAPGVNRVEHADGRNETLGHIGSVAMKPGDVFVIETPGGGGFGAP